jgi:hypothetical protein
MQCIRRYLVLFFQVATTGRYETTFTIQFFLAVQAIQKTTNHDLILISFVSNRYPEIFLALILDVQANARDKFHSQTHLGEKPNIF